jgi:uncharacterized Rossmann fold enzyme
VLDIVCVKWGTKFGPEYVNILQNMVMRNLPNGYPGRFICYTDDPTGVDCETRPLPEGVIGWWGKLYLFSQHTGRTLFFDLDTVICGPLDDIADHDAPFTMLRELGTDPKENRYGGGVIGWNGDYSHIWTEWVAAGSPSDHPRGDQWWIERCVSQVTFWQDVFPGKFQSFKFDQLWDRFPTGNVVCFHGTPRPHQVMSGWVPRIWKVGGGSSAEIEIRPNVEEGVFTQHILANKDRGQRLRRVEAHDRHAVIVAGGPSLKSELESVRSRQEHGQTIFAVNGACNWLWGQGIKADACVLMDAREDNAQFIRHPVQYYLASQCHPSLFDKAPEAIRYHGHLNGIEQIVGDEMTIAGGSTSGLKACVIAYALGYRNLHLYGFDSSYADDEGHAYPQPLNDNESIIEATWGTDEVFRCAGWMIVQAEEFQHLAKQLVDGGATLTVHGSGLLPTIAKGMQC